MLTSKQAALLNNDINVALKKIGTDVPQTSRNTDHIAFEYYVATVIERLAKARKVKAQRECVKAGVMFDHEANPLSAKVEQDVYTGDIVDIKVKTTVGRSTVDHTAFTNALIASGVDAGLVEKLSYEHTKLSRPPHIFDVTLAIQE